MDLVQWARYDRAKERKKRALNVRGKKVSVMGEAGRAASALFRDLVDAREQ